MDSDVPVVPVGTHAFRQLYLFAFATQAEVLQHVRTQALEEEATRLDQIMDTWALLQPRVAEIVQREAGFAETMQVTSIPEEHSEKLAGFASDPMFQRTYAGLPTQFAQIEIDKLIAPQRTVNLDYSDRLRASYSQTPTLDQLIDICVSPKRSMDPIQHLEIAPNTHAFSSPNSDIRFLGAFFKDVTSEDLAYAATGGIPAAAIIAFVGYGAAPVNVLQVGSRFVLNNGFHRVYTLRALGVPYIPVVLQQIRNPQLEFPPAVAGLPREYLLQAPRPVLMKDFFEPDFAITLSARERIKVVTMGIALNQHDVPA